MYSKLIQDIFNISSAVYSYRQKNKSWTITDQLFIQKKLKDKDIVVSLEQVTYEYLGYPRGN